MSRHKSQPKVTATYHETHYKSENSKSDSKRINQSFSFHVLQLIYKTIQQSIHCV